MFVMILVTVHTPFQKCIEAGNHGKIRPDALLED